jgi:ketosteroid isomerase-like protein
VASPLPQFPALLLFLGFIGACHASTPETPASIVRAQRARYNAAIAAHDAERLRTFLVDDYHLISGSSGNVDSGADAATRSYADEEFKDPTFVTYRRTPASIVTAKSGKRIAETGRFEGIWNKSDGTMRKTGIYLAMWVSSAGTWRLKSEAFVTLACTGSMACEQVD